jgi:hypothetical protein
MVRRFFSLRRAVLALVTVLALGAGLALTPSPASAAVDFGAGIRAIDAKYASSNFAAILGAPTSGTFQTPERPGLYRHYERGSIYWAPWIGARAVYGSIHTTWGGSYGWENGMLGFPTSDEKAGCENITNPVAGTRQSIFEGGLICWVPGETGQWPLNGIHPFLRNNFRIHTMTAHLFDVPGAGWQFLPIVEVRSGINLYIRIDTLTCTNLSTGRTATNRGPFFAQSPMRLTSSLTLLPGNEVRCSVAGQTTGDPSIYRNDTYSPDNTLTLTF